jgi:mycothiol synthase
MTTILPADVTIRVPRKEELEAICEMLNACDLADCGMPDSPLEQLRADWLDEKFHPETDARLAVAPGERIVGYATVGRYKNVHVRFEARVHPDYRGRGIGSHLLAFVERRAQDFVPLAPPEARVALSTWCHSGNTSGKQLLEAADFICNRHTWAMAIDLSDEPPQPEWPAGITLRPFVPERDARAVFEAVEEAFEDHWGHLPSAFEDWYQRRTINNERFDPSLWFVALDGAQIAGVSLCDYYLDAGIVDTLAVRRPWRRLGLGLALLRHSFGEYYRRGMHKVVLGVDSQNLTGATRLYERAGMYIELSYDTYEKELRPGIELSTQALEA